MCVLRHKCCDESLLSSLQLRVSVDVRCEVSYYNEQLSVWEPLLEPLEDPKTGRLQPWCLSAEVRTHLWRFFLTRVGPTSPSQLFFFIYQTDSPHRITHHMHTHSIVLIVAIVSVVLDRRATHLSVNLHV